MNIRMSAMLLTISTMSMCSAALAAADGSQLALPPGASVAIVIFEDLQCPDCAQTHPQVIEAAQANEVPLVVHDFPITRHAWAFPAAVVARYFTAISPALGMEFRLFIFEHQREINPDNLRQYAETFAEDHHLTLPPDVDPDGALKAQVQADFDLGMQIHLEYVPLIFIVGGGAGSPRFVEITDPGQLDDAIADMRQGPAH